MLKRRTGIILLTLLFVTGLAGTLSDNTISKDDRKTAVSLMKATYKDATSATKGLSEVQLNYRAAPDKWSIKECFLHIAAAEKLLWTMFESAMKAPANSEERIKIKVTDEQVIKMVEDRTKKAQAPEPIQLNNTGYTSLAEALIDFENNRMAHIKYMKYTTEDLRNHVVELPVGWIDCYQLYLFIAGHSNRHTQQMNEVKANASFPAK